MKPQPAVNFNYDTPVVTYKAYNELEKTLKTAEAIGFNKGYKKAQADTSREIAELEQQIKDLKSSSTEDV